MGYKIRQIEPKGQQCEAITVEAITEVVPIEVIEQTVKECGAAEQRTQRLSKGLRFLYEAGVEELAVKSSISSARYRLGAKVLEVLFKRGSVKGGV